MMLGWYVQRSEHWAGWLQQGAPRRSVKRVVWCGAAGLSYQRSSTWKACPRLNICWRSNRSCPVSVPCDGSVVPSIAVPCGGGADAASCWSQNLQPVYSFSANSVGDDGGFPLAPASPAVVLMVAILDPPREEAVEAIKVAHKAGITVKMITGVHIDTPVCIILVLGCLVEARRARLCGTGSGIQSIPQRAIASSLCPCLLLRTPSARTVSCCAGDHSLTALAIGKMLGIANNGIVFTGPELDRLSSDALR